MDKIADPKMHTAEHILNQAMVRTFDRGRAFSAHIEKRKSKCDYRFDRNPTDEEIASVERQVNAVIASDLPVTVDFLGREAAAAAFNLGRLPDDAGDRIRIVRVGDYDACPCSGAHAGRTGELSVFRIISRDFADGVLRIRFKLGEADA